MESLKVGDKVEVTDVKIDELEKSHSFTIGTKVTIVKDKLSKRTDGNDALYLCTDGNTEQYLWASEFAKLN